MFYFRLGDNSDTNTATVPTYAQDYWRLVLLWYPLYYLPWQCAELYLSLFSIFKSHVLFQRDITKWPCDNKCLFSPNLTTKHTQQQRARLGWDPACRGDWSVILPGSARPDCVDLDLGFFGLISKVSWVSFLRWLGNFYQFDIILMFFRSWKMKHEWISRKKGFLDVLTIILMDCQN